MRAETPPAHVPRPPRLAQASGRRPEDCLPSKLSLLIVDDDARVLASLARALKGAPASIRVALDAEEALHVLETETIDAVISDWQLGGSMDGIELLRRAHHLRPLARLVLHTGESSPVPPTDVPFEVWLKPTPLATFRELIDEMLGDPP